jgi:hypothetical protein
MSHYTLRSGVRTVTHSICCPICLVRVVLTPAMSAGLIPSDIFCGPHHFNEWVARATAAGQVAGVPLDTPRWRVDRLRIHNGLLSNDVAQAIQGVFWEDEEHEEDGEGERHERPHGASHGGAARCNHSTQAVDSRV